jgi:hypothetical protein
MIRAILSVLAIGLNLTVGSVLPGVRAENIGASRVSAPVEAHGNAAIRRLPSVEPTATLAGQLFAVSHCNSVDGTSHSQAIGCNKVPDCWCNIIQQDSETGGLLFPRSGVTLKIGGFIKADLIHDFDAIEDTDRFNTGTIFTDGREGQNTRGHARLTRFNLDVRWPTNDHTVRTFAEVDFFGSGSTLRLRHAYGEVGPLLAGQTWSTFIDPAIIPAILDNESSQSGVFLTRRLVFRWTQPLFFDGLTGAVAVEDAASTSTIIPPPGILGRVENTLPDFVGRLHYAHDQGHLQSAAFIGASGFQPQSGLRDDEMVWGFNFTGSLDLTENDTLKFQTAFGDGLSRFDGVAAVGPDSGGRLSATKAFTWAIAYEHDWSDCLSSTFAYAKPRREPADGEPADAIRGTQFLAVNLVWQPFERTFTGIEYLFGSREDKNGARGEGNRVMFSVRYNLP